MTRRTGVGAGKLLGGMALGAMAGALIGLAIKGAGIAEALALPQLNPLQWTLFLLGVPVVILTVLAVHEAGHLLAGRLVGFRFLLFITGPFRVTREGGRVRVGWNRSPALAGGVAATGPTPDRLERLRQRTAVMVAGGPVTSLVVGLALGTVYLGLGDGATTGPAGALRTLAFVFALTSLAIAVVTLFPGRASGFLTDGARLLRLLRGGPRAEADTAGVALMAYQLGGVRPRDWNPALVERALLADDGPFRPMALHQAWRHADDTGDEVAAQDYRKSLLASLHELPQAVRPGILLDLAADAALAWDPAEADLLLEEAGEPGPLDDGYRHPLAEAALAAVDGRPKEALAKADAAESLLDRAMDAAAVPRARERIHEIRGIVAANPAVTAG